MTLQEAIQKRHSVRTYLDKPLSKDTIAKLHTLIKQCNTAGNLHIQLVQDEPKAFACMLAHYGHFTGVRNYLVLIGKKAPDLDERCGYYGEQLVLAAQTWGLNTCWIALTYKKISNAFDIRNGEKMLMVIAIGYGTDQGTAHPTKSINKLGRCEGEMPDWFRQGIKAAALAPTAMNQQRFHFSQTSNTVHAKAGLGFYTKTDLGIAKYHFELGAGKDNFNWS